MNILNGFLLSPRCSNRSKDWLEVKAEQFIRTRSSTKGFQDSGRKAAFKCTITYGTFIKQRATTSQIVPQIREHLKKQNGN